MRLLSVLALAMAASGCLPALPRPVLRPTPAFDPLAFFEGRTAGLGVLDVRGTPPEVVRVESVGTRTSDGLRLQQTVRRGDDEPSERTWELRQTGPTAYAGTLTDASGPVEATVEGNRLTIRYKMGAVTSVTQHLTLETGGRLALNLMTVRVLGIPWARLTEQIRRTG